MKPEQSGSLGSKVPAQVFVESFFSNKLFLTGFCVLYSVAAVWTYPQDTVRDDLYSALADHMGLSFPCLRSALQCSTYPLWCHDFYNVHKGMIFGWVWKVIFVFFGFATFLSVTDCKTRATFLATMKQTQNHSWLHHTHFPAFGAGCV